MALTNCPNKYSNSSLFTIEIAVTANCCGVEVGKIAVSGDTLRLSYHGQEHSDTLDGYIMTRLTDVCDCDCCFHFIYTIKGLREKPHVVFADNEIIAYSPHKYKIQPVHFEEVNGDTINYYDLYGFKQGIHIRKNSAGQVISELQYRNNIATDGLYMRRFFDNGKVRFEVFKANGEFAREIDYYQNGQIKKECEIKGLLDKDAKCQEYDEEGERIIR